jgi:hypothetical protein
MHRGLTGIAIAVVATALVATACAQDGGDAMSPTIPPASTPTTAAPATTAAPTPTAAPTTAAPTTAAPTTTETPAPTPMPAISLASGTYRLAQFAIPFDLTVEKRWLRYAYGSDGVIIGRGTGGSSELIVRTGWDGATTPDGVLDAFCADSGGKATNRKDTTLLGQPARQADISVTADDCVIAELANEADFVSSQLGTIVAAMVNGQLVVVVADAPADDWPALADEIDRTIASMTPVPAS